MLSHQYFTPIRRKQLIHYYYLLLYTIFITFLIKPILSDSIPSHEAPEEELPVDSQSQFKCQPVNTPLCNIDKYLTVQPFNNTFGHKKLEIATAELHKYGFLHQKEPCKSKIKLFLCSLYVPVCAGSPTILDKQLLLPCRDDCEEARRACIHDLQAVREDWPNDWECSKFNYRKDDKLCVIDNAKENNITHSNNPAHQPPLSVLSPPPPPPAPDSELAPQTETACAEDMFDCKLYDPIANMNSFCIDKSLVCDGKKDCVMKSKNDGLDEVGCEISCSEGHLACDGKCIDKSDMCNGKLDCSSGLDEQECYDYVTGVVQSMVCIFTLFLAIFLLVTCFRIDDQKSEEDSIQKAQDEADVVLCGEENLITNVVRPRSDDIITQSRPLVNEDITNEVFHPFSNNSTPRPIYQEPTYSTTTKSDYERLNTGGYSGCSSVYMYLGTSHYTEDDLSKMPAAPPPTPVSTPVWPPLPHLSWREGLHKLDDDEQ